MCVCVCVKSYLTSGASVCPKDIVTYSLGDGGQKFVETTPLQQEYIKEEGESILPRYAPRCNPILAF